MIVYGLPALERCCTVYLVGEQAEPLVKSKGNLLSSFSRLFSDLKLWGGRIAYFHIIARSSGKEPNILKFIQIFDQQGSSSLLAKRITLLRVVVEITRSLVLPGWSLRLTDDPNEADD